MAEEYTPTTDDVRNGYCDWMGTQAAWEERAQQFDRWLAAHDAQVRAESWDEALHAVWQLADPAFTIAITPDRELVTEADVKQALADNPYRTQATR